MKDLLLIGDQLLVMRAAQKEANVVHQSSPPLIDCMTP